MKAAAASNVITSLAGRPSTLPACPCLARAGCGVSGGARRISRASGATASATITANTSMVCRQPNSAMPRSNSGGQRAPATYWPLEINANAVPRRRSNQRLT